jgi:hypothetical protein
MRLRLIISIGAALGALGCAEDVTSEDVVGSYMLATIDNKQPPRLIGGTSGCVTLLVGGRLELRPGPDWSDLALARAEDCRAVDGGVRTDTLRYLGRYFVSGGTLTFQTQHSLEDTLRFSGPVWLAGGAVTLVVRDTIRGLGEHRLAFF